MFDFAENALLPKLQKRPGQLHFVTGLKFDIFGISCSNLGSTFVFGLPGGKWKKENTANFVISILHYVLDELKAIDRITAT